MPLGCECVQLDSNLFANLRFCRPNDVSFCTEFRATIVVELHTTTSPLQSYQSKTSLRNCLIVSYLMLLGNLLPVLTSVMHVGTDEYSHESRHTTHDSRGQFRDKSCQGWTRLASLRLSETLEDSRQPQNLQFRFRNP